MRVTVIMPAYNAAATIVAAMRSVLDQSHRDVRLIIVDDGSTDDTAALISACADPRLTVIRQPNAGVSVARNRGMAAAEGDALLFLDADDCLAAPSALLRLIETLEASPDVVASVGPYARTGPASDPPRAITCRPSASRCDVLPRLLIQNLFANGGHILVRAEAARAAGGFRPALAYGEDWDFFIRVALRGPFAFVPGDQPVLLVRSLPGGAYRRHAANPAAFVPCVEAIFGNPALLARFGPRRLAALRRRTEAENAWIVGRELVRQGHGTEGRHWLVRSLLAAPSLRRLALLALANAPDATPPRWRGPFRPYSEPPAPAES